MGIGMIINKSVFKRSPLVKTLVNEIGSRVKFKCIVSNPERIRLDLFMIPPMSEMKIHEPLVIPFIIDADNKFCQPVINLPDATSIFGDSLKNFSFVVYRKIVQDSLYDTSFNQVLTFSAENLEQIKEAIISTILSAYDLYREQLEGCVNTIVDSEKSNNRFILVNNVDKITADDVVSNKRMFNSLEEAKKALLDAMIKTPSKDLVICDTHNSDNPEQWEKI